jgi:hypothetical protein
MRWVRDIDSFYDFISLVVVHAPDEFPVEDYLPDDEQLNLERAFAELRKGVDFVERDFPGADRERGLNALLAEALALYRAGEDVKAAHLLQDFEAKIFKRNDGANAV